MRLLWLAATFTFLMAAPMQPEYKQVRTNPGSKCGNKSRGLPDFYDTAVFERIEPPDWRKSLIRIAVGQTIQLDLWTDGEQFKLWTDTPTPRNIEKFLLDLDQSCRLPADPAEAAALIKVKWESAELSSAQFAQIHQGFTTALSQYTSSTQGRYSTMMESRLKVIYLDSILFRIVYDNSYEHIEVQVWNDPKQGQNKPMLDWIHQLLTLAEANFHRPFKPETTE